MLHESWSMTQHVNRFSMNNRTVYLLLILNFQLTIKWSYQDPAHGKTLTLPLIAAWEQQHHLISKPNFARPVDMTVSWLKILYLISFQTALTVIYFFLFFTRLQRRFQIQWSRSSRSHTGSYRLRSSFINLQEFSQRLSHTIYASFFKIIFKDSWSREINFS